MQFVLYGALIFILYCLVRPLLTGAVYLRTDPERTKTSIELAAIQPGTKIADLGSGNGSMVIEFAKHGALVTGYEINPLLVYLSRRNIRKAGLSDKVVIRWKSFWKADLSQFDVVYIYGISFIMNRLERKLERELRSDSRVVATIFPLPHWKPVKIKNNIYLYTKPTK